MLVIFLYMEVLLISNQKLPCWAFRGTKPTSYNIAQHQNQLRCWPTEAPVLFVSINVFGLSTHLSQPFSWVGSASSSTTPSGPDKTSKLRERGIERDSKKKVPGRVERPVRSILDCCGKLCFAEDRQQQGLLCGGYRMTNHW